MNSQEDLPFEHFPLVDAIDHEILMHRDAHFGGKFSIMRDYYQKEGRGVQPEFKLSRIDRLALLEEQIKQNLAALFLTAQEMQKVADSRVAYQKLREIYEVKQPKTSYPRLIADLILTESEEAEEEIAALHAVKDVIVPALITLLRSEELYDPLFPGYGQAPFLAVQALSQIGDKRAIISLFEALGQGDFFADELIIKAFKAIGEPAKEFLIHVVKGRPLNEDNERAAIGLIAFKEDEKVASLCFDLLQQPDVLKDPCLPTYLVLCCVGLEDSEKRKAFKNFSEDKQLPPLLIKDMEGVMHDW